MYADKDIKVEEFRADLAAVSESDLENLKAARETAEAAETEEGGFNDAIDAAGGKDTPEGQRLQVGYVPFCSNFNHLPLAQKKKGSFPKGPFD